MQQATHGGLQPVLIHHSHAEGPAFTAWAQAFIQHTPLVLVVANNSSPLDYYALQHALPGLVVLRELDLESSARWRQLSDTLVQLGPVRRALQAVQGVVVATLPNHHNVKLVLSFIEHAVQRDQVAAMELQDLNTSRGTLSRRFKTSGYNEPTVMLLVVRAALLNALVAQGLSIADACGLLHTSETAMRRSLGRRCAQPLATVARYPTEVTQQWCASFFLEDQPVVDASGAFELLVGLVGVSQSGRRTA